MRSELKKQLTFRLVVVGALAAGCVLAIWQLGVRQGLDLKGGTELLYSVKGSVEPGTVQKTIDVVQRRINPKGVAGIDIRQRGKRRFMIRLPNMSLEEASIIEQRIQRQGQLYFSLVDTDPDNCTRAGEGKPVPGLTPFVEEIKDGEPTGRYVRTSYRRLAELELQPEDWFGLPGGGRKRAMLVRSRPEIKGDKLDSGGIRRAVGENGLPAVGFAFRPEARRQFQYITERNKGKHLAIILDDILYSAPVIKGAIRGAGVIENPAGFSPQELNDLILTLRAGSLPANIELEAKHSVGPELGRDSIRAGITAAMVGMALVMLLMAAYYLGLGLVADATLLLNLLFILGALAAMRATLTLPGIAGLILTVGMAVDANVLILERIREERARGKTLRLAVKNGYERAFTTIVDANLTTLITAVILFFIGTGPIKGFATVLSVGIVCSLFSALFVSRLITELLLRGNLLRKLTMLQMIRRPHLAFSRARHLASLCSVVVIVIGLAVFLERGEKKYDSDLVGGIMVDIQFAHSMPIERVRERVSRSGYPNAEIQRLWVSGGAGTEKDTFSIRVKRPSAEKCVQKLESDLRDQLNAAGLLEESKRLEDWTYSIALTGELAEADLRRQLDEAGYHADDIRELIPVGAAARDFALTFDTTKRSADDIIRTLRDGLADLIATNEVTFRASEITKPDEAGPDWRAELTFSEFVQLDALKEKILLDIFAGPRAEEDLRVRGLGNDAGSQVCLNVEVLTRDRKTLTRLLAQPDMKLAIPSLVRLDGHRAEIGTRELITERALRERISRTGLDPTQDIRGIIPKAAASKSYIAAMGTVEDERITLRNDKVVEMITTDLATEFRDDLARKKLAVRFTPLEEPPPDKDYVENAEDLKAQGHSFLQMTICEPDAEDKPYGVPIHTLIDNLRKAGDYQDALLLTAEQRDALRLVPGEKEKKFAHAYLKLPAGQEDPEQAGEEMQNRIASVFSEPQPFRRTDSVGELVSGEMRQAAIWAIVVAMGAIVLYIWFRFGELKFGLAAIAALVHDVLLTMGAIAGADALSDTGLGEALGFSDIKINLAMVGAFLTIVGYSLNDTIVVFDRIRENLAGRRRSIDAHLIDSSINQVLSRTVLTSITTLIVVLSLYVFGGPVIHGFAFALAVGVLVGTYSSIFIASPILLDWDRIGATVRGAFGLLTFRFLRPERRTTR